MTTISEILGSFEILKGLNLHQRTELHEQCEEVLVGKNATIFREGDDSTYMIFLLEGTMELRNKGHLCDVPALSVVGEMAALTGDKRSASLTSLTAARYLTLPQENFSRLVELDRDFGYQFYRNLTGSLMDHLKKNNLLLEFYQSME